MPRLRRTLILLGTTVSVAAAAAPTAVASDASLRKVVVAQEKKATTAATAFTAQTQDATSAIGRERAQNGLEDYQAVVKKLRAAVVKEKAGSSRLVSARTTYLKAVDRLTAGLRTFGQGLMAFDPDSPKKAADLIAKANAQLKSATTARKAARARITG